MCYAYNGNLKLLKAYGKTSSSVNKQDRYGFTALMYAVKYAHVKCVSALVSSGANIELKTHTGITSLMLAAMNGNLRIVKYLVSRGANVISEAADGETAIHFARKFKHETIATYLLEHACLHAARTGDVQLLDSFVNCARGIDITGGYIRQALLNTARAYGRKAIILYISDRT